MATTPATRFALSTAEALDFAITAIRHMSRDEAIAIVAAIRDHLDGANCGEPTCTACSCPRCHQALTFCDGASRCLNVLCCLFDRPLANLR